MKRYQRYGNYDLRPLSVIETEERAIHGAEEIGARLGKLRDSGKRVFTIEMYPGARQDDVLACVEALRPALVLRAEDYARSAEEVDRLFARFLTEDRVFGVMNPLTVEDCYTREGLEAAHRALADCAAGPVVIFGMGASLISQGDVLLYADMPRWEIQLRYREGMPNWHAQNENAPQLTKYKRGYFMEWRMADRVKRSLMGRVDYWLSTVSTPVMITGRAFHAALDTLACRPFRTQPYFDPGIWGGHWMADAFHLPENGSNYAWCFDGVPEENSLNLDFHGTVYEMPAINLVFGRPKALLGERVYARFGAEYPIRFDYLDTMGGGNLSLQVHPTTDYISQTFGMRYTQDESYYIVDVDDSAEDPCVYLGLREGVDPRAMEAGLKAAQRGDKPFEAKKYINAFPVKKHDHVLIPAGMVHCSGANTMVLEISSTPYIFTFKLWDWDRMGLDGLPRPIHLDHGLRNIQWDRTTPWVEKELLHRETMLHQEEGVRVERTGLHELEFIDVVRYALTRPYTAQGNGSVRQLNLVEGTQVRISSPTGAFAPFIAHYCETFVIPASVQAFTIEPIEEGEEIMLLDAFVR